MVISWMCVFSIVILCSNFLKFIYIELFIDNKTSQTVGRNQVNKPLPTTKRAIYGGELQRKVEYKKASGESFSYQSYENYRRKNTVSR